MYIEAQEKLNVREPLEDFADPLVDETWFWKKPVEGQFCSYLWDIISVSFPISSQVR